MDELKFRPQAKAPVLAWSEQHQYLVVYLGLWSRIRVAMEIVLLGRAHIPQEKRSLNTRR
jgi:hypothetical protein